MHAFIMSEWKGKEKKQKNKKGNRKKKSVKRVQD